MSQTAFRNAVWRLHFHHTADGKNYIFLNQENEEEFWRLSNYIEETLSFDEFNDPQVLRMAGKAFGQFEAQLSDFDASQLTETIPHFHDTYSQLQTLCSNKMDRIVHEVAEQARKAKIWIC